MSSVIYLSCLPLLTTHKGLLTGANQTSSAEGQDIHGISTHKVYPILALLQEPVSFYLTFSPLPSTAGRLFSVTLSVPCLACSHPLDGVVPYVVRTFLFRFTKATEQYHKQRYNINPYNVPYLSW